MSGTDAIAREVMRRDTRRKVERAIRKSKQALAEVMDDTYGTRSMNGPNAGTMAKKSWDGLKKAGKKASDVVKKEVGGNVKSVHRALKYRKKGLEQRRAGNKERSETMMRRANAVLKNRGASVAAATAVAPVGIAMPWLPTPAAMVGASKYASGVTKKMRAKHVARKK